MKSNPPSVKAVCDDLGRAEIAAALGVRKTAVSNAVTAEKFPAHWYNVVRGMCAKAGIDCPDALFNFAKPKHEKGAA